MIAATALAFVPAHAATNLVVNGSFEGPTGGTPTSWSIGGTAGDNYLPVAIAYNQASMYPFGAQNESVPTDDAASLSPDTPGLNGVYFVSDHANNLSLYQTIFLTPGSYFIGFDSYDTYNGAAEPNDAHFTANILDTQVADFSLSSVSPGNWTTHAGNAQIKTAGDYFVSFTFNTTIFPAKDVVIDRAYVIANPAGGGIVIPSASAPEPASWAMMVCGFGAIGSALRRRRAATASA